MEESKRTLPPLFVKLNRADCDRVVVIRLGAIAAFYINHDGHLVIDTVAGAHVVRDCTVEQLEDVLGTTMQQCFDIEQAPLETMVKNTEEMIAIRRAQL